MMLGILVKSAVYLYGGLKGLEYVFRVPYRYFVFPISMIVAIFSILTSANFAEVFRLAGYTYSLFESSYTTSYTICDYGHFDLEIKKE